MCCLNSIHVLSMPDSAVRLTEGDIKLTSQQEKEMLQGADRHDNRAVIINSFALWPSERIPYIFSSQLSELFCGGPG